MSEYFFLARSIFFQHGIFFLVPNIFLAKKKYFLKKKNPHLKKNTEPNVAISGRESISKEQCCCNHIQWDRYSTVKNLQPPPPPRAARSNEERSGDQACTL